MKLPVIVQGGGAALPAGAADDILVHDGTGWKGTQTADLKAKSGAFGEGVSAQRATATDALGVSDPVSGHACEMDPTDGLTFDATQVTPEMLAGVAAAAPSTSDPPAKVSQVDAAVVALTDGETIPVDMGTGRNFSVTLGGNRTLANPSNPTVGQSGIIVITQDGTGGRTLAFGTYYKFAGSVDPSVSTAANAVDVLAYVVVSATAIYCNILPNMG